VPVPSQIFHGKGTKKELVLELSEGEDIFECIRNGMLQNGVTSADVKAIEGNLCKASINYMRGSRYVFDELENVKIEKASGKYELKGKKQDQLYGNLHVVVKIADKPVTATLVRGKASEGTKVHLEFIEVQTQ